MPTPSAAVVSRHIRSPFGWPLGIIGAIVGFMFSLASVTTHRLGHSYGGFGFGLAVIAGSYVLGIRPGLSLREGGLEIRNPIRTAYLPWAEVAQMRAVDILLVTDSGGRVTRVYAVSGSVRRNVRVQSVLRELESARAEALQLRTSAGSLFYGWTTQVQVALGLFVVGVGLTVASFIVTTLTAGVAK